MALKRGIKCLTHTELHLIEAIGQDSLTMNELAERIGITMGTATVAVSKLTEKGFIARVRSNSDRRKVFVSLTPKGAKALAYHNNYHKMIMSTLTEDIADKDLTHFIEVFEVILNALRGKTDYFKPLLITEFPVGTKVSVVEIKGTPIVQNFFASHGIENFTAVSYTHLDVYKRQAIRSPSSAFNLLFTTEPADTMQFLGIMLPLSI